LKIEKDILKERYYVGYVLPFNILLVYKYSFSDKEEAQRLIKDTLIWFHLLEEEEYLAWEGRKVFIPVGGKRTEKNIYRINVSGEASVEAKTPVAANKAVHSLLSPHLDKMKAEITSVQTLLKGK